jgi:hypothetical protein
MTDSHYADRTPRGPRGVSRRDFLIGLLGGLAGTAFLATDWGSNVLSGGRPVARDAIPRTLLDPLTSATYAELLGERFRVRLGALNAVDVELAAVTDLSSRSSFEGSGECFSILFRGPQDQPFQQDTYTLQHDQIGVFDLFLVPIGPDAASPTYEAVVNRLPA